MRIIVSKYEAVDKWTVRIDPDMDLDKIGIYTMSMLWMFDTKEDAVEAAIKLREADVFEVGKLFPISSDTEKPSVENTPGPVQNGRGRPVGSTAVKNEKRNKKILKMFNDGWSRREIADKMEVSYQVVYGVTRGS